MTDTEDEKNLFVGMGGMGNHPSLPGIGGDYRRGFADNEAGVFTGVTSTLGGVWSGAESEAEFGSVSGANVFLSPASQVVAVHSAAEAPAASDLTVS